jgi:lipopolysaccharide/colanic/teichoic acid biosynthesis glycosyltransferase
MKPGLAPDATLAKTRRGGKAHAKVAYQLSHQENIISLWTDIKMFLKTFPRFLKKAASRAESGK